MSERGWMRSLYWRIGLGLILFLAVTLVLQAALFVWLAGVTEGGMPERMGRDFAELIASEFEAELARDPGVDLAAFAKERIENLHRPAVVIIELGGNDGLRGTPIEVVRSNLARMIELSKGAGARVVLAGIQIPTNYGGPYTRAFAGVYPELAKQYRIGLVDFILDGVALDINLFQADGIHPTVEAQKILLENVWPALEKELKVISGKKVPQ